MSACERCHSPLAADDLRCPICSLPVPAVAREVAAEAVAAILRCEGCAAAVSYDAKARAPKCSFCGAVMHMEQPQDPIEQAQQYVRFRVDASTAQSALRSWLGGFGFFRPPDLQTRATVDSLKPLWWVAWIFDARVLVSWAADSNAGSRRSSWAPHSGQRDVDLRNVLVPASRGLEEKECIDLTSAYNIDDVAAQPEGNDKATVERFTVQRSAARRVIARSLQRVAAGVVKADIPGSTYRNLHVAVLPRQLSTARYAFPAFVLAYRYNDRLYRAIVHGQDPSRVIGSAPYSWLRIGLTIFAAVAIIAGIVAAVSAA